MGKADRARHADGKAEHHGPLRDAAVGDVFDLPVEHVDGRFRRHEEVADEHAERNEQPAAAAQRELLTEVVTGRHEADVDAGQEQRQADEGIEKADADFGQLGLVKSAENQLKQGAEHDDRQQRGNDFADVIRQGVHKLGRDLTGVLKVGNGDLRVAGVAARVEDAEQQDREHRADAAQQRRDRSCRPVRRCRRG